MKPTCLSQPVGSFGSVNARPFLSLWERTEVRVRYSPLRAEILEA
jgi:hypothetical protein